MLKNYRLSEMTGGKSRKTGKLMEHLVRKKRPIVTRSYVLRRFLPRHNKIHGDEH